MDKLYAFAGRLKLLYRISPTRWLLIMLLFLVSWTVLMLALRSQWKLASALNLALTAFGLLIIVMVTFVRRGGGVHQMFLVPLRPLFGIRTPRDYWQVTAMNLLVYVPFSCGLVFCLAERIQRPVGMVILFCFLISVSAEAMQYELGTGTCEVDDVLVNTLGAVLGTLPYMGWRMFGARR